MNKQQMTKCCVDAYAKHVNAHNDEQYKIARDEFDVLSSTRINDDMIVVYVDYGGDDVARLIATFYNNKLHDVMIRYDDYDERIDA